MPMKINESAPQWVKDIWPDAVIVPDGELMGIKPAVEAHTAKAVMPTTAPKHWEESGINPHAKPDGSGDYGRD